MYTAAASLHTYIYTKPEIRISTFYFSEHLLCHIIDNDKQMCISNLMNFMFIIMHGNLN